MSACGDKTVKLWNLKEWREEYNFIGHTSFVTSVCLNSDSSIAYTGSWDKTIKAWNLKELREEFTLYGHSQLIKSDWSFK